MHVMIIVWQIAWLVSAVAPAGLSDGIGSCPGSGDCCVANGTPGCDNTTCCDLVCAAEPSCCAIGWSQSCVDQAVALCSGLCTAPGCPGTESCCETHASPGCDDEECCERVCVANPNCCSSTWSGSCVTAAQALCSELCNPFESCSEDNPNSCCRDNESEGCSDVSCCAEVCSRDAFCCNSEWDDICVGLAISFCGKGDGEYCFDEWCPDEGSCCATRGTPGCNRSACCRAVCEASRFCCHTFWTSGCVSLAQNLCVPTVCDCDEFGDFNGDGLVNLLDFAEFQLCFTGLAGPAIGASCACGDDNGDGLVDLPDYASFPDLMGLE